MSKRRFFDAPQGDRCKETIVLKDKTTADCGRRAKIDGRCKQHHKKFVRVGK